MPRIDPSQIAAGGGNSRHTMLNFRSMKTLQKFSSVHAALHNHFNQDLILSTARNINPDVPPQGPSGSSSLPEPVRLCPNCAKRR